MSGESARSSRAFPNPGSIYTQLGRPDDGTDPKGWNNIEIAVYLPPHEKWVTRGPRRKRRRQGGPDRADERQAAAASRRAISISRSTSRTTSRKRSPA